MDDVREIHILLRGVLETAGHKVFSALDTLQATKMARELLPDLVILDIAMPGGGGYVAFERLRTLQGTARIPVLIYSAKPREEVTQKIPEASDVRFLSKPCGPQELTDAVERLLAPADAGRP
ncbi:MAG: response regulator [Vicinamibacteria bacterium]